MTLNATILISVQLDGEFQLSTHIHIHMYTKFNK